MDRRHRVLLVCCVVSCCVLSVCSMYMTSSTHMQHTQIELLILCLLQKIIGRNNRIRQQMALRHKFRRPLDQAVIERPDQLRMCITELQRAVQKFKKNKQKKNQKNIRMEMQIKC